MSAWEVLVRAVIFALVATMGLGGLLLWVAAVAGAGDWDPLGVLDQAREISFPLYSDTETWARQCTGFFAAPVWEGGDLDYVVTAGHCALMGRAFTRMEDDHVWWTAWPLYADMTLDLDAAVMVGTDYQLTQRGRPVKFPPVLARDLAPGEALFMVSFAAGGPDAERTVLRQYACAFLRWESDSKGAMDCSTPVRGGSSGSAVLTAMGEWVGIMTHGSIHLDHRAMFTAARHLLRQVAETTRLFCDREVEALQRRGYSDRDSLPACLPLGP